jgi:glycosyltransferase involved in cell wall biosynthesis
VATVPPPARGTRDRLTVLHVSQPAETGAGAGMTRMVTALALAQVRAGHRVSVACPPAGGLAADAGQAGATVVSWPGRRAVPTEVLRLRRILDRVRPDLVHLHGVRAGLVGRLAVRGALPTVYQPRGWSFQPGGTDGMGSPSGPRRAAALRWERAAAGWTDRIVCVTDAERRQGEAAGVRGDYAVVRNGIDLTRFSPADPGRRRQLRAQLGIDPDTPLAVRAAAMADPAADPLLAAWPSVRNRVPGARLALLALPGGGPDRGLGWHAASGVHLAGPADDPRTWYHAADLVVVACLREIAALVPLEAMACGRPVVATDLPGAAEYLPAGPDQPAPVPQDRPDRLAEAVATMLTDPARSDRLGRAARATMQARFSVHRATDTIETLYTTVMPGATDS